MTAYYLDYIRFTEQIKGWNLSHGTGGRIRATEGYLAFMHQFGFDIPAEAAEITKKYCKNNKSKETTTLETVWNAAEAQLKSAGKMHSGQDVYDLLAVQMANQLRKLAPESSSRAHSFSTYLAALAGRITDSNIPAEQTVTESIQNYYEASKAKPSSNANSGWSFLFAKPAATGTASIESPKPKTGSPSNSF